MESVVILVYKVYIFFFLQVIFSAVAISMGPYK